MSDKKQIREQATEWLKTEMVNDSTDQREKQRLTSLLQKTKEEELRYARAFGNGSIDEEQLKMLATELKKKTISYEAQLREIADVTYDGIIDDKTIDALCDEAQRVLQSETQPDKKKLVQDIIDKVIIFDEGKVRVEGHVPQFTQYMGYELTHRNRWARQCGEVHII